MEEYPRLHLLANFCLLFRNRQMLTFHVEVLVFLSTLNGALSASVAKQMMRRQHKATIFSSGSIVSGLEEAGKGDFGSDTRWVTSAFGDCTRCEVGARQLRNVSCQVALTGKRVDDSACEARLKPVSFKECTCTPEGTMPCTGNTALCSPTSKSSAVKGLRGDEDNTFVDVGCFKKTVDMVPTASLRNTPGNDFGCQGWAKGVPCHGGLPFYSVHTDAMSPSFCFSVCLSKGLDIFGIDGTDPNNMSCRCGATVGLVKAWDKAVQKGVPTPNLVFNPSALTPELNDRVTCPLRIYRYAGHLQDGSIPFGRSDMSMSDIKYKDQIVCNCNLSNAQLEDSLSAPGTKESPTRSQLLAVGQGPSWTRNCYPGNCQSGGGPWGSLSDGSRTRVAPPGAQPGWLEYVIIRYVFNTTLDNSRKEAFRLAATQWSERTCLVFQESLSPTPWPFLSVTVQDPGSCFVAPVVGKPPRGWNSYINLGWCDSVKYVGSIMHEIGHVLGMLHTQQRPDAAAKYFDKGPHLTVYWNNVRPGWEGQYLANSNDYTGSTDDGDGDPFPSGYSPYDFESIMHYAASTAFDTIPVENKRLVGNRARLTSLDVRQVNDAYQCKRPATSSAAVVETTTTAAVTDAGIRSPLTTSTTTTTSLQTTTATTATTATKMSIATTGVASSQTTTRVSTATATIIASGTTRTIAAAVTTTLTAVTGTSATPLKSSTITTTTKSWHTCGNARTSTLDLDRGYADAYRGWYDTKGCGLCIDYCRWVSKSGSGGDPAVQTTMNMSYWSCALAGSTNQYSLPGEFGSTFKFAKCRDKDASSKALAGR
jgi:hypothetical protein